MLVAVRPLEQDNLYIARGRDRLTEACQQFAEIVVPEVGKFFGCLKLNAFHHADAATQKKWAMGDRSMASVSPIV